MTEFEALEIILKADDAAFESALAELHEGTEEDERHSYEEWAIMVAQRIKEQLTH